MIFELPSARRQKSRFALLEARVNLKKKRPLRLTDAPSFGQAATRPKSEEAWSSERAASKSLFRRVQGFFGHLARTHFFFEGSYA
jgi:hypothetical protein